MTALQSSFFRNTINPEWPSWMSFDSRFRRFHERSPWLDADQVIKEFDHAFPRDRSVKIMKKASKFNKKIQLDSYKPEEIEVTVTNDRKLQIKAKKEYDEKKNGCKCSAVEIFYQTIDIPKNVDTEKLKTV